MTTNNETLNALLETILHTPVLINFTCDLTMPYAACEPGQNKKIKTTKTHVYLYNMLTDKYDSLAIDDIDGFKYWQHEDETYETSILYRKIELDKEQIKICMDDPNVELDEAQIIAARCETNLQEDEWNVIKHFKFEYSLEQLVNPDEETMRVIRDKYMDYIRIYRDKAFEELDQLESETKEAGGTEDDLSDINTIKQMFRDIPQDVSLEEYGNIIDLYDFWPSLLLPKPADLIDRTDLQILAHLSEDGDPYEEFKHLANQITNPDEIKLFRAQLGNLSEVDPKILHILNLREISLRSQQTNI